MTTNLQFPITLKLILSSLAYLLVITLFFITSTEFSPSSFHPASDKTIQISNSTTATKVQTPEPVSCSKIPRSLADALIHYASSNTTPQQTLSEISVTKKVLDKTSPCNFLVFGLGHDSLMWASLNHGGRTIFLEEDDSWIRKIAEKFPSLESYHVRYDTKVREAATMLSAARDSEECRTGVSMDPRASKCELALKGLPEVVYETEWDLIMVDAPTGFHEEAPGRMSAIYTAGMMARSRREGETTDVFVHDVDRTVEDEFVRKYVDQICGKTETLLEREDTHDLLTEFGQLFAYVSGSATDLFIIDREILQDSQLNPDPKYTQEITRNFLKKFFCEKKKCFFFFFFLLPHLSHVFFLSSLVLSRFVGCFERKRHHVFIGGV